MTSNYSLAEETAKALLELISGGDNFRPGSKLPNENELSALLNVSRGTLREAIRILATRNILQVKRGLGTFISEDSADISNTGLRELSSLEVDLADLMEMRIINEPECAFLAAQRATEKEIQNILTLGETVERKMARGEERIEEEQLFHIAIAKATHNDFMRKLIPVINESIYKEYLLYTDKTEEYAESMREHKTIMEFIKNRDSEGAKAAMKLHLLRISRNLGMRK